MILRAHPALTGRQRKVLEAAARYSASHGYVSFMSDDFERPVSAARQLDTYSVLFAADRATLDGAELDVETLRQLAADAGRTMGWRPEHNDFSAHRLNRQDRARTGLGDLSRRQYHKRWRFLCRLAAKADRIDAQLRLRGLVLAGRSGLVSDITCERFRNDVDAACFVAYYSARRKVRRQFTLSGKENPFDEIAAMLYGRCETKPDVRGTDSSTWNIAATAYNHARDGWINALAAVGVLDMLDLCCPPTGQAPGTVAAPTAVVSEATPVVQSRNRVVGRSPGSRPQPTLDIVLDRAARPRALTPP